MRIDELCADISDRLYGWCGARGAGLIPVCEMVALCGNGDHLEIGSLWGATAIAAALTKKYSGGSGNIYCVDPMEYALHEPTSRRGGVITRERAQIMPEIFAMNLERFGVSNMIKLIRKKSQPVPDELVGKRFTTSFIDGWHYGNTPSLDVKWCAGSTDSAIILDDAPLPYYPSVEKAFRELINDNRWIIRRVEHRSALFVRRPMMENIWWHTSTEIPRENITSPEGMLL